MKNKPTLFSLISSNKVNREDIQKLGLEIIDKNAAYAKKMKLIIWLYFLIPLSYTIPFVLTIKLKWSIDNIVVFKVFSAFYIIISLLAIVHSLLCLTWLGRYTIFGAAATKKKISFFTSIQPVEIVIDNLKRKSKIKYLSLDLSQYENLDYSKKRFELIYWLYSMLFLLLFIILFIIIFYSFLGLFYTIEM